MATPPSATPTTSSQHEPHLHIKSAARKLPIKRNPNHNNNPNNHHPNHTPSAAAFSIIVDDGDGGIDQDVVYEEGDEEECYEDDFNSMAVTVFGGGGGGGGGVQLQNSLPAPFKFHRIWSELDEMRFLQGLLACGSQGLVFPRDLNVFFDRFSETMTQPYTRSQLSEKLRRFRKKFRVVCSRVARGLDPSTALSAHDRDLYELSTQLWHPSCSDSSPFAQSGPDATKRRKRLPPPPQTPHTPHTPVINKFTIENFIQNSFKPSSSPPLSGRDDKRNVLSLGRESKVVQKASFGDIESFKAMVAKAILDSFDNSVKELKQDLNKTSAAASTTTTTTCTSSLFLQVNKTSGSGGDLADRWQEQLAAEFDVHCSRLSQSGLRTIDHHDTLSFLVHHACG
ncbi:DNA-binding storekeeper protein-related transcriptional regulator [Zostera marina]|uniref:DNA-binding storekeeper protein-related transcriptional regulator n=1 Tax=Zostera marina TaxID=29655 RepID=A0A0K9PYK1_ZOSMR|nr:DNA-binding storekeeper protein-related transcriptional regulator [Zostera marina]